MEGLEHLPLEGNLRQPWRNGGGWTREIARGPENAGTGWDWRLSVAEVEADGPFSAFPGIDREIVLLSGAGMALDFADGRRHRLDPVSPRLRFGGDDALDCRLLDGPTTDFNLMWSRARCQAELWLRPLVGGSVVCAEPGETWAVHLQAGRIECPDVDGLHLASGDTLLLHPRPQRRKLRLEASGSAIVVRIRPVATG